MKPLATLLTIAVTLSCLTPSAQADRKSRAEEKARQQRLERQLRDLVYILKHESDGTLSDRKAALNAMISTGVAPDEAYWQAGYIKRGDEWVSVQDRWLSPDDEKKVDEYVRQRTSYSDSDEDHYKLAQWCAENGLDGQAYAHLKAVLLSHPDHVGLRKLLGYQMIGSRWMNVEDYNAAVREADRLAQELQQWGPVVAEIRDGLHSRVKQEQLKARNELKKMTEVSAVPALELILLPNSDIAAAACVDQLCEIDHRRSSIALCKAAMFLPESSEKIKLAAIEELKTRMLDDFVPVLLGKMQTPMSVKYALLHQKGWEYSHGPFNMPNKYHIFRTIDLVKVQISSESNYEIRTHALELVFFETLLHADMIDMNGSVALPTAIEMYRRLPPAPRNVYPEGFRPFKFGSSDSIAGQGRLFHFDGETEATRRRMSDRLLQINRTLEQQNQEIERFNQLVTTLLGEVTDQSVSETPEFWWTWWKDRIEVEPSQKLAREVNEVDKLAETFHLPYSCFVAGTPVWTDRGPRPIEQLRVGDMALSKDVETGELAYRPIIRTTTREPKPLVTIDLGAERITSTGGHPFFVTGEGWVRARELRAAQILHTPTGTIRIDRVTETPEEETYNLVVDGFHTYFVGMSQALVHDVSITSPTDAIVPGLLNR